VTFIVILLCLESAKARQRASTRPSLRPPGRSSAATRSASLGPALSVV